MKNIVIMCVIIAVTTISCKKENDELIVGKWKITSIETFEEDNTTLIEVNNNNNWGYVFEENNTGYSYTIVDGTETITSSMTYSINNDTLFLYWEILNKEAMVLNIKTLDNETLKIYTKTQVADINGNFIKHTYSHFNLIRI
ncbi:MAG: hypothetical protein IKT84_02530 [Bacteroidales bacterium]|nr:hypothetical protein [Bacteroidales bacterium]